MTEVITTNQRPDQPGFQNIAARIQIEGLFVLCANWDKRIVQLGVYDLASTHDLTMRIFEHPVKRSRTDPRAGVEFDPRMLLENLPMRDLHIDVPDADESVKLRFYQNEAVTDEDLTFRETEDDLPDPDEDPEKMMDYRWIANPDHANFRELFKLAPDQPLPVVPHVITRKIHIGHGVLYASDFTRRVVTWAFEASATQVPGQLPMRKATFFARQITIAIPRDSSVKLLTLSSTPPGAPLEETMISLPVKEESYYDIRLTNLCAKCDSTAEPLDPRKHSDFHYYYNLINIPVPQRIDIQRARSSGEGSNLAPCDPIYLGNPPELP